MKDISLLVVGFASGVLVTTVFWAKVKTYLIGLLDKTVAKIEGK